MKKGILAFLFLGSFLVSAQGKIELTTLEKSQLPKGIKYSGEIKQAVRWTDQSGDNIVITTETGDTESKSGPSEDYRDAALYATHFLVFPDSVRQTWKVHDFIKECPLDIEANFVKNTFQVTDLNGDGIAEVWLMYIVSCKSDVSPADMKIIMYQGNQKYALRGHTKVEPSHGEFLGGDYKFDKAFNEGPAEFRDFAKKLWKAHLTEKWY
ncbi:M949_RS01915 family surface polysaccharide biosynthesis protein [Fluviicola sp.]|uniref:M949_RS01915 family surface polysaccharide biosynthesis protein n=1 Tax=Fluviicola sp. TaxID=1917219 RepID=UPI003D29E182